MNSPDMPTSLRSALEARLREQVDAEVRRDVQALYEFTLPSIRESRIAERNDEPALSLSEIEEFVALVNSAELLSFEVERFHPAAERFARCPAALVVSVIRYNQQVVANSFRCLWVHSDGAWYTTSLGKVLWSKSLTLYRPVGPAELKLIEQSGWTEFPPRLPEQPIFYPVLNEEYAKQIARDWNVKESGSGYVTRFAISAEFVSRYARHIVGGPIHEELWVPAEELAEFNRHIVGPIEVIAKFP